jgi:uncharacterized protein YodC (DUF2158 family)
MTTQFKIGDHVTINDLYRRIIPQVYAMAPPDMMTVCGLGPDGQVACLWIDVENLMHTAVCEVDALIPVTAN